MTTEHRIPSQLFLVAGKEIESAMRQDVSKMLLWHDWRTKLIATWENGAVVLLHPWELRTPLYKAPSPASDATDVRERLDAETEKRFFDFLIGQAKNIYIKDGQLYLQYTLDEEIGSFLRNRASLPVLNNLCREIAGRDMPVYVHTVEATEIDRAAGYQLHRTFSSTGLLLKYIEVLLIRGETGLAEQVKELLIRREYRQTAERPPEKPLPRPFNIEGTDRLHPRKDK